MVLKKWIPVIRSGEEPHTWQLGKSTNRISMARQSLDALSIQPYFDEPVSRAYPNHSAVHF
jgi:hypothetical protein